MKKRQALWFAKRIFNKGTTMEELIAALIPFARFADAWDRKPLSGADDTIYALHGGDGFPNGASFKLSDCYAARDAINKAEGLTDE